MRLGKICPGACSTCTSTIPLVECQVLLRIANTNSGAGVFLIDLIKIKAHVAYSLLPGDFFVNFISKFVPSGKVSGQSDA